LHLFGSNSNFVFQKKFDMHSQRNRIKFPNKQINAFCYHFPNTSNWRTNIISPLLQHSVYFLFILLFFFFKCFRNVTAQPLPTTIEILLDWFCVDFIAFLNQIRFVVFVFLQDFFYWTDTFEKSLGKNNKKIHQHNNLILIDIIWSLFFAIPIYLFNKNKKHLDCIS